MSIEKVIHGGLEATSKGEMLSAGNPKAGAAGYVAMEMVTGKLDGKPYPIKGSPAFDTLAYHPMNERTYETTARKNGKVVMTAVIAVAKDGKSRTVTLIGTDAKGKKFTDRTYYDKQP